MNNVWVTDAGGIGYGGWIRTIEPCQLARPDPAERRRLFPGHIATAITPLPTAIKTIIEFYISRRIDLTPPEHRPNSSHNPTCEN